MDAVNTLAIDDLCGCLCHTGPYAACDHLGGCRTTGCGRTQPDTGRCQSGEHCHGREPGTTKGAPTPDPLCTACLETAERDTRALVYDYLDLAQLHEASLSQAVNEKTSGGAPESPTLVADHVEALQAEIVHVVGLWEHALRAVDRLSNPRTFAPLWRTRVYDHLNLHTREAQQHKARGGAIVQRAVGVIAPRLDRLAALPATVVCQTGIEDQPAPMAGWEAVHHLQALHKRARAYLGRTRRAFWLYGDCPACDARSIPGVDGPLFRSEPGRFEDPMTVGCDKCGMTRPYPDYEHYMANLVWQATADTVEATA